MLAGIRHSQGSIPGIPKHSSLPRLTHEPFPASPRTGRGFPSPLLLLPDSRGLCRGRSVPGSRDVAAGALRTGGFAVTASKGGGNDDSRTTRVQGAASGRHSPAGDAPPLSPAGSPPSQVMFPRTPPCWWPQGIPHPQLTCVVDATHSAVAQPLSPRGRSL